MVACVAKIHAGRGLLYVTICERLEEDCYDFKRVLPLQFTECFLLVKHQKVVSKQRGASGQQSFGEALWFRKTGVYI